MTALVQLEKGIWDGGTGEERLGRTRFLRTAGIQRLQPSSREVGEVSTTLLRFNSVGYERYSSQLFVDKAGNCLTRAKTGLEWATRRSSHSMILAVA